MISGSCLTSIKKKKYMEDYFSGNYIGLFYGLRENSTLFEIILD